MEHWKAMKEKKSVPVGIPLKLSKELAVHKWVEQFAQDLEEVYGARDAPLTYLTRADVATPVNIAAAPRAVDQPYAKIYTSIQEEMKFCLSHTHNLMRAENATLLHRIDTAVAGHFVSATIAPYRKTQDGRGHGFLSRTNMLEGMYTIKLSRMRRMCSSQYKSGLALRPSLWLSTLVLIGRRSSS
jgi:hypothetical protein